MKKDTCQRHDALQDYGGMPVTVNMEQVTRLNPHFRTALWTGKYLQVTLMRIPVGGEIGLEMHPDVDQLLRIESGRGLVKMGCDKECLNYRKTVDSQFAVIVPAGTWHNLINTGNTALTLYSVYAPPQHPYGTVHRTKAESDAAEHH